MARTKSSFWFWVTPPLVVGILFAAYQFYLKDRFFGEKAPEPPPNEETRPPAGGNAKPPVPPVKPGKEPLGPVGTGTGSPVRPGDGAPIAGLAAAEALLPELIGALSANPELAGWLKTPALVREFVVAVDSVANGFSPAGRIRFWRPAAPFSAVRRGGAEVPVAAAFGRYDLPADIFCSIDTAGAVAAYRRLEPVLREVYRGLGYPDGDFGDALSRAAGVLLATPTLSPEAQVERAGDVYYWRDPALERLNEAQKHFLRMGPRNVERIRAKIRELADAAGIVPR